jgi:hypothetical protein
MPSTRPPRDVAEPVGSDGEPPVAHLEIARSLRVDPDTVRSALEHPSWLGRLVAAPPDRPDRRVETDLSFTLGADGRTLTFSKAALVDIGPLRDTADGPTAEIGWQAASFAPLFPVFAGRLIVDGGRIRLVGEYAPPGGGMGLLVDRAILHHFAQRTAGWLLDRLVAELRR